MKTNPLDHIKIASPCSADWDEMRGDNRKRYCSHCKLNVYNLSEMTRNEAENLLFEMEGKMCVRLYKRQDGTVITQDCPVGWQIIKQRVLRTATAAFSLIVGFFGGVFGFSQINFDNSKLLEDVKVEKEIEVKNEKPISVLGGLPISKKQNKKKKNYQAVNGRVSDIRDLQDEPVELWIK